MSYDEIRELCKKSWKQDYNYLCALIDVKREIREDTVFVMKAETHVEHTLETKTF